MRLHHVRDVHRSVCPPPISSRRDSRSEVGIDPQLEISCATDERDPYGNRGWRISGRNEPVHGDLQTHREVMAQRHGVYNHVVSDGLLTYGVPPRVRA